MNDYLKENNNDEPFYFTHDVIKNGRLLLDSTTFNPQGNKLHRHMMKIEGQESTVDLSSDDPTDLQYFLIAFAQGMGLKVDKQLHSKTLAQVRDLIEHPTVVAAVKALNEKDGEYSQDQLDAILAGVAKGEEKTWSLDALVAYAAYEKAKIDGVIFTHDLMVEADGITNGPGIATIQFGIGFSREDKALRLKKIGVNVDGDVEEFGAWIDRPMNRDNYETITLELNNKLEGLTGRDKAVKDFTIFLLGKLDSVNAEGIQKINRNISKNPLMTTIYGAGKGSLKAALGNQTVQEIYLFIEKNVNNPTKLAELDSHLQKVFNLKIDMKNPLEDIIDARSEQIMSDTVGEVVGQAMIEAIDEQYGQFKDGTIIINEAMGMVAEVFSDMFEHAVEVATTELVEQGVLAANAKGVPFETLPQDSIDKILLKLIESQPILQSVLSSEDGNITEEGLYVGKITNTVNDSTAYNTRQDYQGGRTVNTQGRTPKYISGGVSPVVLAVQNIDATAMLKHLNDYASFNVYDAIITGVDSVEKHTLNINKHFFEINKNHSIAMEAQKAFLRAEAAAVTYDAENGTDFATRFNGDTTRGFGKAEVTINIKQELEITTVVTEAARLDTIDMVTSSGQYGWENSSHVVKDDSTPLEERVMGSNPDATDGKFQTEAQIEINNMTVLDVFDEVGKLGNKEESKEHASFLRNSLNSLRNQILEPIKLHIGDVLKNKDAKGNDTMANIEGSDIYMYTKLFGGQPGSTGILNSGLRMSAQEAMAHEMWHAVSRHGIEGNELVKKELERRWEQAKSVITPFDLMDNPTLGESSPEYAQAQDTWNYIFTAKVVKTTVVTNPVTGQTQTKYYSNHFHEFAAYSMTNEKFIKALKSVPANTKGPAVKRQDDGSYLNSLFNKLADLLGGIVDYFSTHLTSTKGLTTDVAVRELVKQISNLEAQNRNAILSSIDTAQKAAGKMSGVISKTTAIITKPLTELAKAPKIVKNSNTYIRLAGRLVRLRNESETVEFTFNALTKVKRNLAAKKQGFAEQLLTEVRGLTEATKNYHTLSRMKTKMIDGAVVGTETNVITLLTKAFSTPLTEVQLKAVTKAFLKTDLSSMNLNQSQLLEILNDPTKIPSLIATIEAKFAGDVNANHYVIQSKALGHMMATGRVTSANQNFNAKQIARLFGTGRVRTNVPVGVEKLIDQLATLYALQDTDSSYKIALSELIKSEKTKGTENGMTFLQAFHNKQKEIDLAEVFTGSEVNVTKGHVRDELDSSMKAMLLTEAEGLIYEARGWTKGTELFKDPADPTASPLYLYVDRHGGDTQTITGIISLTSKQARGTDTIKIRQTFGDNSPVYGGKQDATRIHSVKSRNYANSVAGAGTFNAAKASTQMAPLFDLKGEITGYRYLMTDKTKDNVLNRNQDAIRILARGAASTVNKVNSAELNGKAIEAMKLQFDAVPDNAYLQFGPASTDAELRELYRLLPDDAKADIKRVWGSDTMFVDKQILTMMFGYRKFSVADALAKDKAEQHILLQWFGMVADMIGKPFGFSGEQVARSTGQYWGEFVSASKDFIVIKSGIVTAANTVSNSVQLFTEGLNVIDLLKWQKEAAVELTKYRQQNAELFELEKMVELGIQANQLTQQKNRIAQLKASLTSNPVTDIVEDGLLQTIVEDVGIVDDQYSKFGKIRNVLDKHIGTKIPGSVRQIASELTQSHDSFLYKKMAQSAQLSDFVARYALYKHSITNKNTDKRLSREDAANKAISTFINYDLPTHRGIQYGNDMGFLWFTKYYIRIQKILLTTLASNPARVMALIVGEWAYGDVIADMYDSTLSPENVGNRVRLPGSFTDMASNALLGQLVL
jgi:hypothetical protein